MTFNTLSDLVKASDTQTHQCLDLSDYFKALDEDENESENFAQIFVIVIPIAGLWHYFQEIKADGVLGPRTYELIMTSSKEI